MNGNKIYLILKKGRAEVSVMLSLYTLLVVQNKQENLVTILSYFTVAMVLFILMGLLVMKYLDPNQPKVNPYLQDSLKAGYHHRLGLALLCEGHDIQAKEEFLKANELMARYIEDYHY